MSLSCAETANSLPPSSRQKVWEKWRFRSRFLPRNLLSGRRQWLDDSGHGFRKWLAAWSGASVAYVYGNAPSLSLINPEQSWQAGQAGVLRIGINRSFLQVPSDVLLWTDSELWPELVNADLPADCTVVRIARRFGHPAYIRWWMNNQSLAPWPGPGLFFLRNTLVSALHFCYLAGIRRIALFGVSLEDASHFYSDSGETVQPYEHHDKETIRKVFHGYDIQRCVREVLESLMLQGFDIRYVGESQFLGRLGLTGYPDYSALVADPGMKLFTDKE